MDYFRQHVLVFSYLGDTSIASGEVCQCAQQERGGIRFGQDDEAVAQRPKTKARQPRDEGENPVHRRCSPFVKMSESMLVMVLFLWGIGKKHEK